MSDAPLTNPLEPASSPPRPQQLGDVLREARENKNLSLNDVADITHIRKEYLRALDEGRYDDLPEEVYTRNFIKLYAGAVGLDDARLLERYSREREHRAQPEPEPLTVPVSRPASSPAAPPRKRVKAARGGGARAGSIVTTLLSLIFVGVLVGVGVWGFNELFLAQRSPSTQVAESTGAVTGTQAEPEVAETGSSAPATGFEAAASQSSVQNASTTGAGTVAGAAGAGTEVGTADTVFLTLTSVPPNAEVSIDNYDFPGTTPLERAPMTPGEDRVLRVSREGYETFEAPIDLTEDRDLSVVLTPLDSATGGTGTLITGAGAETDTVVNGEVVDTVGANAVTGGAGTLSVTVEATSWLEAYTGAARGEGETLLYRNVEPGETLTFDGPVYLFAGNAGGVLVAQSGGAPAPLGNSGQVLGRAFGN